MSEVVVMAERGKRERSVPLNEIVVPDLWHVAMRQGTKRDKRSSKMDQEMILEVWHLAHDLLKHLRGRGS